MFNVKPLNSKSLVLYRPSHLVQCYKHRASDHVKLVPKCVCSLFFGIETFAAETRVILPEISKISE